MANIPIYDGSPTFTSGSSTPFGFYDADSNFQTDSVKVAKFCANRLGYPLVEIELQSGSFFTAFEEAVTTYGNELYAYKVRQDYLSLEGASTGSNLNHALIEPNMATIVRMSEQYGEEAGVGGNVEWYSGSIVLTGSKQTYDLNAWAVKEGLESKDIGDKKLGVLTFPLPYVKDFPSRSCSIQLSLEPMIKVVGACCSASVAIKRST